MKNRMFFQFLYLIYKIQGSHLINVNNQKARDLSGLPMYLINKLIKLILDQFKQLAMLPVKSNNHQPKNTRAQSRRKRNQTANAKGQPSAKIYQSKNKKKDNLICANQLSDTTSSGQPTLSTGIVNRKGNQGYDSKTTLKKINFENKPIIKDLAKKINSFSKQYVPEYFTTILEYMIEKETRNTMCPTVDKINRWRVYIDRQREIEAQVRIQFLKMTSRIITGRKKMRQEIRKEQRKNQAFDQDQTNSQENKCFLNSDRHPYQEVVKPDQSESSSHSSIQNASCPQIQKPISLGRSQPLTERSLLREWQSRYDQFAFLIQTIFDYLGQQQCSNTIFPTCYIFYIMCVADTRVFSFLKEDEKCSQHSQPSKDWRSVGTYKPYSREPTAMNMVEYYMIASILIATKYHEIYPASLIDLIDNVNYELDYEYAIKIEGQILQMLNFAQFFNDHEHKYLKMFSVIIGLMSSEINVCEFIMQSGLNNPNLYLHSPLYKAAVVIGLYEQQFLGSQQKFMMIKSLCPGLSFDQIAKIKKEYMQAVSYNNRNKIMTHKRKYFIFENEMKRITKDFLQN